MGWNHQPEKYLTLNSYFTPIDKPSIRYHLFINHPAGVPPIYGNHPAIERFFYLKMKGMMDDRGFWISDIEDVDVNTQRGWVLSRQNGDLAASNMESHSALPFFNLSGISFKLNKFHHRPTSHNAGFLLRDWSMADSGVGYESKLLHVGKLSWKYLAMGNSHLPSGNLT